MNRSSCSIWKGNSDRAITTRDQSRLRNKIANNYCSWQYVLLWHTLQSTNIASWNMTHLAWWFTYTHRIHVCYAIYGNIYHQYTPNVSTYTSTMDPSWDNNHPKPPSQVSHRSSDPESNLPKCWKRSAPWSPGIIQRDAGDEARPFVGCFWWLNTQGFPLVNGLT